MYYPTFCSLPQKHIQHIYSIVFRVAPDLIFSNTAGLDLAGFEIADPARARAGAECSSAGGLGYIT